MPDRTAAAATFPRRYRQRSGRGVIRQGVARILSLAVLAVIMCACGNASPAGAPKSSSTAPPAPMPASCQQWHCSAHQTVALPGKYAVTLWLGSDQANYQSRPVVELLAQGTAVQWWISPVGDGWNGSLTCATSTAEPNCDVIDSVGMHASVAEMLILRDGRLIHPTGAVATTNSSGMSAADLTGDGYLDVIGSVNDYRPNYAQGHNYWQTFEYRDDRLQLTGCAAQPRGSAPPRTLLTGTCPIVTP
jgi:hypothetical protein